MAPLEAASSTAAAHRWVQHDYICVAAQSRHDELRQRCGSLSMGCRLLQHWGRRVGVRRGRCAGCEGATTTRPRGGGGVLGDAVERWLILIGWCGATPSQGRVAPAVVAVGWCAFGCRCFSEVILVVYRVHGGFTSASSISIRFLVFSSCLCCACSVTGDTTPCGHWWTPFY